MKNALMAATLIMAASASGAGAQALETIREQAHNLCMMDAMTLCASAIPNEDAIVSCMAMRRTELSPPCRQVFDAGLKAKHRRRTVHRAAE